jgi:hypothetical protein
MFLLFVDVNSIFLHFVTKELRFTNRSKTRCGQQTTEMILNKEKQIILGLNRG